MGILLVLIAFALVLVVNLRALGLRLIYLRVLFVMLEALV